MLSLFSIVGVTCSSILPDSTFEISTCEVTFSVEADISFPTTSLLAVAGVETSDLETLLVVIAFFTVLVSTIFSLVMYKTII